MTSCRWGTTVGLVTAMMVIGACESGAVAQRPATEPAAGSPRAAQTIQAAAVDQEPAPPPSSAVDSEPGLQAVDLEPEQGALPELLLLHAVRARKAGLKPVVEMHARWCPICKRVDRQLAQPRAEAALSGVYLIRVDTDAWQADLRAAGLTSPTIPTFYELDGRGVPGRSVRGHRWPRRADAVAQITRFLEPSGPTHDR